MDLENDGDLDVLLTPPDQSNEVRPLLLVNDGTGAMTAATLAGLDFAVRGAVLGDIAGAEVYFQSMVFATGAGTGLSNVVVERVLP